MKFAKRGDRKIVQQNFDKEKIMITKAGKTYNVYDAIQAANIDTDIYEVLKKYHCSTDQAVEFMKEKGGLRGIFTDIAELQNKCESLADIQRLTEYADKLFLQLPLDVRNKYGHNLQEFLNEYEEKQKAQKQLKEKDKKEVTTDEQK